MQKAIIHTATRVVRRLTTDDNPQILPDETAIDMSTPLTLDGFQKLDGDDKTLVKASQQDIDDAGVDEARQSQIRAQKVANVKAKVDEIINEPGISPKIKSYFQALKEIQ
jgi:hypothetical protein